MAMETPAWRSQAALRSSGAGYSLRSGISSPEMNGGEMGPRTTGIFFAASSAFIWYACAPPLMTRSKPNSSASRIAPRMSVTVLACMRAGIWRWRTRAIACGVGARVVGLPGAVVLLRFDQRLSQERHHGRVRIWRTIFRSEGLRRSRADRHVHRRRLFDCDVGQILARGLHDGALAADDRRVARSDILRGDTADEELGRPERAGAAGESHSRRIVRVDDAELGSDRIALLGEILRVDSEVGHGIDEPGHDILAGCV